HPARLQRREQARRGRGVHADAPRELVDAEPLAGAAELVEQRERPGDGRHGPAAGAFRIAGHAGDIVPAGPAGPPLHGHPVRVCTVFRYNSASTMGTQPAALNPFVYARPLAPHEAIGRDDDVARLLDLAEGSHNATLFAPRRFGKTSLLKQLVDAAED